MAKKPLALTKDQYENMHHLTPKELQVIQLRKDGDSYEQIGRLMRYTRERVRQIQKQALKKLNDPPKPKDYNSIVDQIRRRQKEEYERLLAQGDGRIEELDLSVRAGNCLRLAGIVLISEVVAKTDEELLSIRNLGVGTLKDIRFRVQEWQETKDSRGHFQEVVV